MNIKEEWVKFHPYLRLVKSIFRISKINLNKKLNYWYAAKNWEKWCTCTINEKYKKTSKKIWLSHK